MITKETFPAEIKRIRRENEWTVKDLAEKLDVSPRTIENWEQGRRFPANAVALVNLFGRS
jgi:DNA-binding transcriptional regulator YiaG